MKGTEQYFPVNWFVIQYKVDLGFEFVSEILKFGHSNLMKTAEQYFPVV